MHMKATFYFLIFFLSVALPKLTAQTKQTYFIDLQITNSANKTVKDAKLQVFSLSKTFVADKHGKIILNIPSGDYIARVSAQNFKSKDIFIGLKKDTLINISLTSIYGGILIEEVQVKGRILDKLNNPVAGLERLDKTTIEKIPALLGEKDPIKALQFLPGVIATSEGSAEINVRGGGNDQNMITLDEIPIYSSTHLFGLFSTFNPLAISSTILYKGDFPSNLGGRLSSVTSLTTTDTLTKTIHGEADLGVATAKASLSVPLPHLKSSFFLAGRRSYYDLLFKTFGKGNTDIFAFQDYNFGWIYQPNTKHKFKLTLYNEQDAAGTTITEAGFLKGSAEKKQSVVALSWKYRLNNQWNNAVNIYSNEYKSSLAEEKRNAVESYLYNFNTAIKDIGVKNTLAYTSTKINSFAGFEAIRHSFMPTKLTGDEQGEYFNFKNIQDGTAIDFSIFAGTLVELGTNSKLSLGLRNNNYFIRQNAYHSLEPRLSFHYSFNNSSSIKISYSKMTQSILRLTNPGLGLPQDIILSANSFNKPQTANHFSLEYVKDFEFDKEKFTFSLQPFYKNTHHIVSFKDGFDTRSLMYGATYKGDSYSDVITTGKGSAYGLEFMLEKRTGKLNGWVNYTYLKALNQFDNLNRGLAFAPLQDRRHSLNFVANWRISKNWNVGFSWMFISGQPVSVPKSIFLPINPDYASGKLQVDNNTPYFLEPGERNNVRMKPFHKLDVTSAYNFKLLGLDATLNLGFYNLYSRSNSSFYYIGKSSSKNTTTLGKPVLKSVSLFPIIPSASLKVKF